MAVTAPEGWSRSDDGMWRHDVPAVLGALRLFEPLSEDGAYLVDRMETSSVGVLGRPTLEYLPDELADGLLIARHERAAHGLLLVRVDIVRRAWDVDIVLSARLADPSALDAAVTALVRLLAAVRPAEAMA